MRPLHAPVRYAEGRSSSHDTSVNSLLGVTKYELGSRKDLITVDTNLTPTQTNDGERRRQQSPMNMLICRSFRTLTNSRELLMLPSHDRGHEFESRRVHS